MRERGRVEGGTKAFGHGGGGVDSAGIWSEEDERPTKEWVQIARRADG